MCSGLTGVAPDSVLRAPQVNTKAVGVFTKEEL